MLMETRFSRALTVLALAGAAVILPACAGNRNQPETHTGYSGNKWEDDFGILEGHCNRQAIGAALGGLLGGVVGAQVGGEGNDRKIAIAIGSLAGAFIGSRIGRDMDEADRACVGHALELAGNQERVSWTAADGRTTYRLTPVRGFEHNGVSCREFDLGITSADRQETRRAKACPAGDGNWRIVG